MNEHEEAFRQLGATLRASADRIAGDWARVGDALAAGMGLTRCPTCNQFQHPANPHKHTVGSWLLARLKRGCRR